MSVRDIPTEAWHEFFDSFSRSHARWLVTIEVLRVDGDTFVAARQVPLTGITAETKPGVERQIEIAVGEDPDRHLLHTVPHPSRVRLEETEAGALASLQIDSADGPVTRLWFRSAMKPELVDGIPH